MIHFTKNPLAPTEIHNLPEKASRPICSEPSFRLRYDSLPTPAPTPIPIPIPEIHSFIIRSMRLLSAQTQPSITQTGPGNPIHHLSVVPQILLWHFLTLKISKSERSDSFQLPKLFLLVFSSSSFSFSNSHVTCTGWRFFELDSCMLYAYAGIDVGGGIVLYMYLADSV